MTTPQSSSSFFSAQIAPGCSDPVTGPTTKSLPEIGRAFQKDHATVLNALRRIEELIKHDEELEEDIMFLTQQLSQRNAA
jgi:hypothetical protein